MLNKYMWFFPWFCLMGFIKFWFFAHTLSFSYNNNISSTIKATKSTKTLFSKFFSFNPFFLFSKENNFLNNQFNFILCLIYEFYCVLNLWIIFVLNLWIFLWVEFMKCQLRIIKKSIRVKKVLHFICKIKNKMWWESTF